MRRACAALAVVLAWAQIAPAQDLPATNRISDRLADGSFVGPVALQRLALMQIAIGRAIPHGLVRSDAPDAAALAEAIAGWPLTPDRALAGIAGEWSCRTFHLRRERGIALGPVSECRVTDDGRLITAQGLDGRIHHDEGLLLWLADGAADDQQVLGVLQVTGPDRARVYFPAPDDRADSLDLMVMRRKPVPAHETGRGSAVLPRP